MNRKLLRIPHVLLLASALALTALAPAASLKDKPPNGVALSGTRWLIDPYKSDDPDAAIERAEKAERDFQNNRNQEVMDRGVPGDEGPLGRGYGNSTWGQGLPPTGNGRRNLPPEGTPGNRDGGWSRTSDRTSTDIDPTGQSGSVTIGTRGGMGHSEFLGQLTRNPETLTFLAMNQHLTVSEDKLETDCLAGGKEPVSDSYGDGERRCGWDGRAWVIETKRGRNFTRVDRFEVSRDGKTLNYTTKANGFRVPSVKISRVYTLAPPQSKG